MSKSIQLKNNENEKIYPHPYYPVGSIYLSVNTTNPSRWFGGTWEQIAKGRTLVGVDTNDTNFNTVKKTGGEKIHTLTINEIPSHSHGFTSGVANVVGNGLSNNSPCYWNANNNGLGTTQISPTGGSQAHNNLQPYFTCYIWCRIA